MGSTKAGTLKSRTFRGWGNWVPWEELSALPCRYKQALTTPSCPYLGWTPTMAKLRFVMTAQGLKAKQVKGS